MSKKENQDILDRCFWYFFPLNFLFNQNTSPTLWNFVTYITISTFEFLQKLFYPFCIACIGFSAEIKIKEVILPTCHQVTKINIVLSNNKLKTSENVRDEGIFHYYLGQYFLFSALLTFWNGSFFFGRWGCRGQGRETVLCIVRCLMPSLVSTYQVPVAYLVPAVAIKISLDIAKSSLGRRTKIIPVENL